MALTKPDSCTCGGGRKIFASIMCLLAVALVVFLAFLIRNENKKFDYIGKTETRDTITISGEGKVISIPDIAMVSFGISKEYKDVVAAQKEVNEKMNNFIAELQKLQIAKEDIQTTNYSLYPVYDWNNNIRTLRGYEVDQQVEVKIRNLDSIGNVLNLAVEKGLNEVNNLSFTIDDMEKIKEQAREIALQNAKSKAETLSKIAEVKLGKLISFNESYQAPYAAYDYSKSEMSTGVGGGVAPEIQPGSAEVVIDVTVTYEIL